MSKRRIIRFLEPVIFWVLYVPLVIFVFLSILFTPVRKFTKDGKNPYKKMKPITILFYPEPLKQKPLSRMYTMCKQFGFKYHNNPAKHHDVHIFWSYMKHSMEPDAITMADQSCINQGCYDISKVKVSKIFDDISVDPKIHEGICVEKLDKQGAHYGHNLVECPMDPQDGYVYQRYIEDVEDELFVKYAIYYHDRISLVVKSWKPGVFSSKYVKHEVIDKRKFFDEEEEADFNLKCQEFGVNYACIEFINDNGKPVIIDVNNVIGGRTVPALTGSDIEQQIHLEFFNFIWLRAHHD